MDRQVNVNSVIVANSNSEVMSELRFGDNSSAPGTTFITIGDPPVRTEYCDFITPLIYPPYVPFDPVGYVPFTVVVSGPPTSKFVVRELNNQLVLSLDVPGVKKEDLTVELQGYILTVRGKRADTGALVFETYSLNQTCNVSPGSVEAQCSDGVLVLFFQKLFESPSKIHVR